MSSKQFVNSVETCVLESLYGFKKLNPHLSVDLENGVVYDKRCESENQKVGIISGGGSGHEPFPAGYVGAGMLNASVSGAIFASPPAKCILKAIELVATKYKEVLLIVPNHTGDVLNFGLASEIARDKGLKVKSLVVGEDIAQESQRIETTAGKRGTCGLVLIIKISAYLAHKGENALSILEKCKEIMKGMGSLGLCASACSKPGSGPPFKLEEFEIELGVGVHGEAGVARLHMSSAKRVVSSLTDRLVDILNLKKKDEVIVMVNNLGSLTHLEQYLLAGEVLEQLSLYGIQALRFLVNPFFTSLDMRGVQICLLKLNDKKRDMVLEGLDHPTKACSWPHKIFVEPEVEGTKPTRESILTSVNKKKQIPSFDRLLLTPKNNFLEACIINIACDLIGEERTLNAYDSVSGDGDCGTSFRSMAEGILVNVHEKKFNFSNPPQLFTQLRLCVMESTGGTTGALYALFLQGLATKIQTSKSIGNPKVWFHCWQEGIDLIKKYTNVKRGDKTMLDALEIAKDTFGSALDKHINFIRALELAVTRAVKACEMTEQMTARAGRASYTDSSRQANVDPGAYAVTVWLNSILSTITKVLVCKTEEVFIPPFL